MDICKLASCELAIRKLGNVSWEFWELTTWEYFSCCFVSINLGAKNMGVDNLAATHLRSASLGAGNLGAGNFVTWDLGAESWGDKKNGSREFLRRKI